MSTALDLEAARKAVAGFVIRTPLLWAADLTARAGSDIYLKLESLQMTGSFKIRGAANRMTGLTEEERIRGWLPARVEITGEPWPTWPA